MKQLFLALFLILNTITFAQFFKNGIAVMFYNISANRPCNNQILVTSIINYSFRYSVVLGLNNNLLNID